ncbi:MAG: enoyl-CoA hydratase/isomerase family protein [Actinobacteria bacterium]|nr:enoyl-CoA hydratase/isomerase family protein [Actinomycetota bacterium]
MTNSLIVTHTDAVATLTLNRPEKLNTLSVDLIAALEETIADLRTDPDIRAVILTGEGRAFCAGVEVGDTEYNPLNARTFLKNLNRIFDDLEQLPQPTIAAIQGHAVAGGLELALACTFRVASERAQLGLPEVTLGLVAAVGTTYRLPRLVGFGRTAEMALLGDLIDADTALSWGLINRVAPHEKALDVAFAMAQRLAQGPPVAMSLFKDALYAQGSASALLEVLSASVNHYTKDKIEGMSAFLEKRPPRFSGE